MDMGVGGSMGYGSKENAALWLISIQKTVFFNISGQPTPLTIYLLRAYLLCACIGGAACDVGRRCHPRDPGVNA
jgi:hypothetical protein